jgi:hypothetical protein
MNPNTPDPYTDQEVRRTHLQIARLSHQPLAARQSARDDYADALSTRVGYVTRALEFIVNGDYGRGPQALAYEVLQAGPRRNKAAALSILLAALDFQCPAVFARQAYLSLDKDRRDRVESAFAEAIRDLTATIHHPPTKDTP